MPRGVPAAYRSVASAKLTCIFYHRQDTVLNQMLNAQLIACTTAVAVYRSILAPQVLLEPFNIDRKGEIPVGQGPTYAMRLFSWQARCSKQTS